MSKFDTLVKDLGATAKRIVKDASVFSSLSASEQVKLSEKFKAYSPKTPEGVDLANKARAIINGFIATDELVAIPVMAEVVSDSMAEKIARETFIFEFHLSQPTFLKKVDSDNFLKTFGNEGNINPMRVRISKYIIDRADLKGVWANGRAFVKSLRDMALPGGLLTPGNGQYLLPLSFLPQLRANLTAFLTEREQVIEEFIEGYPTMVEKSKEDLGPEFNPSLYPSVEELRAMFTTSFKYMGNTVPEEFARVSKEIADAEQRRILAECAAVVPQITMFLREKFAETVEHFASILGKDEETGKPKHFQKGSVDKLKQFASTFKELNLTGDVELEKLVSQTEALLDGVDPTKIRSDEEFRGTLDANFKAIRDHAAKLVTTKTRQIDLD